MRYCPRLLRVRVDRHKLHETEVFEKQKLDKMLLFDWESESVCNVETDHETLFVIQRIVLNRYDTNVIVNWYSTDSYPKAVHGTIESSV